MSCETGHFCIEEITDTGYHGKPRSETDRKRKSLSKILSALSSKTQARTR